MKNYKVPVGLRLPVERSSSGVAPTPTFDCIFPTCEPFIGEVCAALMKVTKSSAPYLIMDFTCTDPSAHRHVA